MPQVSIPHGIIFLGFAGSLVFGFTTFVEFAPPKLEPVKESELTYFRGRLKEASITPVRYGGLNYRIWLEDEPVAFQKLRHSGDQEPDGPAFRAIEPGAEVVVGVKKSTVGSPGTDQRLDQPFLSFITLEANHQALASLDAYNAWRAEDSKRSYVPPLMLACSLGLFVAGIAVNRASAKEGDHERSIRELILRHQAEMAGTDAVLEQDPPLREGREA